MSLFDNDKNPADKLPKAETAPKWLWMFLIGAVVYVVVSCGISGYQTTETAMRLVPKTYTGMSDYEMFVNQEGGK